jgi:phenylalanyl-tRNA synthetase beta chain
MQISYNWIKDYINFTQPSDELAKLLTQIGLEVTHIQRKPLIQGDLQGLVLGQVLACEKHPNADRLYYTQVDIGNQQILSIICGAPNIQLGQKVIVAPIGTKLYPYAGESFTIKKAKIRGITSEGMLCAADELGLSPDHAGILVLDTALPPGTPAKQCLDIQTDFILTVDITPNRADACSHIGVARDLGALLEQPVHMPSVISLPNDLPPLPITVNVEDLAMCPRYSAVAIYGVEIKQSPEWLQQKLRAIDIQPVNNIVDLTNFVMHECGQPLHAYDYDKLIGSRLHVQQATAGAQLVTLDTVLRQLTGEELIISDQKGVIALAGVLGGKHTSISHTTQNVFLESAYFDPKAISNTTKHQHLKTEAAFRYERGTDPNLTVFALKRALFLIQQIAPQATFSNVFDHYPTVITERAIKVYYTNITRLIGQAIPQDTIKRILKHLDISLTEEKDASFVALVPPYRVDVLREVDIIEEILRLYGYDRIQISPNLKSEFLAQTSARSGEHLAYELALTLTAHGYYEICKNSLTASKYNQLCTEDAATTICLLNPLSERLDSLRQSLVFSGLEVITHNINRQQKDLKLFEFGKTYHKLGDQYQEHPQLGIWLTGNIQPANWVSQPRTVNFQDLNSIILQLLTKLGIQKSTSTPLNNAIFESGIEMYDYPKSFVKLGKLTQACLEIMGIKQDVFFAELDWAWLSSLPKKLPKYQALSKFPIVTRDLSLVLDQAITFQQIKQLVNAQKEKLIQDITVFDVYEGASLPKSKKAYALSFALQDPDQTLSEKTIHQVMQNLIDVFEKELGAIIRE